MSIESNPSGNFILKSPSFDPKEMISDKYVFNGMGCQGENLSPELQWEGEPEETESYALVVMDPDAPIAGGWRHWTVVNIPKDVHQLPEGASTKRKLPKQALEVENDFDEVHYGGPCPPVGDRPHRYVFTLYALKTPHLNLNQDSDRVTVETSLENNSIAKTSFTVRYGH